MRKIFLAFSLVGLGAMSASFAACSSSSGDDSTATGTDSGSDTSVVTDTGTGTDTGPVDAGACATCAQILTVGLAAAGTPCTTSTPLLSAILSCACNTNPLAGAGEGLCDVTPDGGDAGPDGGNPACADLCAAPTSTVPSTACQTCGADNCSSEIAACQADTGH
jgi:hypothetical protein